VSKTTLVGQETRAVLRRCLLDARTSTDPALQAVRAAALANHLQAWLSVHLPVLCGDRLSAMPAAAQSQAQIRPPDDRQDHTLGVYWPIRGEPDLRPFYASLAAAGVTLALPVMTGPGQPLQFARWDAGAPLVTDRWGIATPTTMIPVRPAALLIPCVGFNATGHRLGYGGGFYDRTLALAPRPVAIGVAWDNARCDFAAAAHDMPMDVVITESPPA
jgi:5,10-methenyltetrahydrofolate synthetase